MSSSNNLSSTCRRPARSRNASESSHASGILSDVDDGMPRQPRCPTDTNGPLESQIPKNVKKKRRKNELSVAEHKKLENVNEPMVDKEKVKLLEEHLIKGKLEANRIPRIVLTRIDGHVRSQPKHTEKQEVEKPKDYCKPLSNPAKVDPKVAKNQNEEKPKELSKQLSTIPRKDKDKPKSVKHQEEAQLKQQCEQPSHISNPAKVDPKVAKNQNEERSNEESKQHNAVSRKSKAKPKFVEHPEKEKLSLISDPVKVDPKVAKNQNEEKSNEECKQQLTTIRKGRAKTKFEKHQEDEKLEEQCEQLSSIPNKSKVDPKVANNQNGERPNEVCKQQFTISRKGKVKPKFAEHQEDEKLEEQCEPLPLISSSVEVDLKIAKIQNEGKPREECRPQLTISRKGRAKSKFPKHEEEGKLKEQCEQLSLISSPVEVDSKVIMNRNEEMSNEESERQLTVPRKGKAKPKSAKHSEEEKLKVQCQQMSLISNPAEVDPKIAKNQNEERSNEECKQPTFPRRGKAKPKLAKHHEDEKLEEHTEQLSVISNTLEVDSKVTLNRNEEVSNEESKRQLTIPRKSKAKPKSAKHLDEEKLKDQYQQMSLIPNPIEVDPKNAKNQNEERPSEECKQLTFLRKGKAKPKLAKHQENEKLEEHSEQLSAVPSTVEMDSKVTTNSDSSVHSGEVMSNEESNQQLIIPRKGKAKPKSAKHQDEENLEEQCDQLSLISSSVEVDRKAAKNQNEGKPREECKQQFIISRKGKAKSKFAKNQEEENLEEQCEQLSSAPNSAKVDPKNVKDQNEERSNQECQQQLTVPRKGKAKPKLAKHQEDENLEEQCDQLSLISSSVEVDGKAAKNQNEGKPREDCKQQFTISRKGKAKSKFAKHQEEENLEEQCEQLSSAPNSAMVDPKNVKDQNEERSNEECEQQLTVPKKGKVKPNFAKHQEEENLEEQCEQLSSILNPLKMDPKVAIDQSEEQLIQEYEQLPPISCRGRTKPKSAKHQEKKKLKEQCNILPTNSSKGTAKPKFAKRQEEETLKEQCKQLTGNLSYANFDNKQKKEQEVEKQIDQHEQLIGTSLKSDSEPIFKQNKGELKELQKVLSTTNSVKGDSKIAEKPKDKSIECEQLFGVNLPAGLDPKLLQHGPIIKIDRKEVDSLIEVQRRHMQKKRHDEERQSEKPSVSMVVVDSEVKCKERLIKNSETYSPDNNKCTKNPSVSNSDKRPTRNSFGKDNNDMLPVKLLKDNSRCMLRSIEEASDSHPESSKSHISSCRSLRRNSVDQSYDKLIENLVEGKPKQTEQMVEINSEVHLKDSSKDIKKYSKSSNKDIEKILQNSSVKNNKESAEISGENDGKSIVRVVRDDIAVNLVESHPKPKRNLANKSNKNVDSCSQLSLEQSKELLPKKLGKNIHDNFFNPGANHKMVTRKVIKKLDSCITDTIGESVDENKKFSAVNQCSKNETDVNEKIVKNIEEKSAKYAENITNSRVSFIEMLFVTEREIFSEQSNTDVEINPIKQSEQVRGSSKNASCNIDTVESIGEKIIGKQSKGVDTSIQESNRNLVEKNRRSRRNSDKSMNLADKEENDNLVENSKEIAIVPEQPFENENINETFRSKKRLHSNSGKIINEKSNSTTAENSDFLIDPSVNKNINILSDEDVEKVSENLNDRPRRRVIRKSSSCCSDTSVEHFPVSMENTVEKHSEKMIDNTISTKKTKRKSGKTNIEDSTLKYSIKRNEGKILGTSNFEIENEVAVRNESSKSSRRKSHLEENVIPTVKHLDSENCLNVTNSPHTPIHRNKRKISKESHGNAVEDLTQDQTEKKLSKGNAMLTKQSEKCKSLEKNNTHKMAQQKKENHSKFTNKSIKSCKKDSSKERENKDATVITEIASEEKDIIPEKLTSNKKNISQNVVAKNRRMYCDAQHKSIKDWSEVHIEKQITQKQFLEKCHTSAEEDLKISTGSKMITRNSSSRKLEKNCNNLLGTSVIEQNNFEEKNETILVTNSLESIKSNSKISVDGRIATKSSLKHVQNVVLPPTSGSISSQNEDCRNEEIGPADIQQSTEDNLNLETEHMINTRKSHQHKLVVFTENSPLSDKIHNVESTTNKQESNPSVETQCNLEQRSDKQDRQLEKIFNRSGNDSSQSEKNSSSNYSRSQLRSFRKNSKSLFLKKDNNHVNETLNSKLDLSRNVTENNIDEKLEKHFSENHNVVVVTKCHSPNLNRDIKKRGRPRKLSNLVKKVEKRGRVFKQLVIKPPEKSSDEPQCFPLPTENKESRQGIEKSSIIQMETTYNIDGNTLSEIHEQSIQSVASNNLDLVKNIEDEGEKMLSPRLDYKEISRRQIEINPKITRKSKRQQFHNNLVTTNIKLMQTATEENTKKELKNVVQEIIINLPPTEQNSDLIVDQGNSHTFETPEKCCNMEIEENFTAQSNETEEYCVSLARNTDCQNAFIAFIGASKDENIVKDTLSTDRIDCEKSNENTNMNSPSLVRENADDIPHEKDHTQTEQEFERNNRIDSPSAQDITARCSRRLAQKTACKEKSTKNFETSESASVNVQSVGYNESQEISIENAAIDPQNVSVMEKNSFENSQLAKNETEKSMENNDNQIEMFVKNVTENTENHSQSLKSKSHSKNLIENDETMNDKQIDFVSNGEDSIGDQQRVDISNDKDDIETFSPQKGIESSVDNDKETESYPTENTDNMVFGNFFIHDEPCPDGPIEVTPVSIGFASLAAEVEGLAVDNFEENYIAQQKHQLAIMELKRKCTENLDRRLAESKGVSESDNNIYGSLLPCLPIEDISSEGEKNLSYDSCAENATTGSEENYVGSLSDNDENLAERLSQLNKLQIPPLNSFDSPDSGVQDTMDEHQRPLEKSTHLYARPSFLEMNAECRYCKYCSEMFMSSEDLTNHVKSHHRLVMKITKTDANKHVTHMVEPNMNSEVRESDNEEVENASTTEDEATADQIKNGEIKMVLAKESGNSHVVKEIKITPKSDSGNSSSSSRFPSFSPARTDVAPKKRGRPKKYPIFTESELIAKQLAAAATAENLPMLVSTHVNRGLVLDRPLDENELFSTSAQSIIFNDGVNMTEKQSTESAVISEELVEKQSRGRKRKIHWRHRLATETAQRESEVSEAINHEEKRPNTSMDVATEDEDDTTLEDGAIEEQEHTESSKILLEKYNVTKKLVVCLTRINKDITVPSAEADTPERPPRMRTRSQCSESEEKESTSTDFVEPIKTVFRLRNRVESNNNMFDKCLSSSPDKEQKATQEVPVSSQAQVSEEIQGTKTLGEPYSEPQPLKHVSTCQTTEKFETDESRKSTTLLMPLTIPAVPMQELTNAATNTDAQLVQTMPQPHQFCILFIPDALINSENPISRDLAPTATIVNFQPVPDNEIANKPMIYVPTTPTKISTYELNKSYVCSNCTQVRDMIGRFEANLGMTEEDKSTIKCPYCSNHYQSLFYLEYHVMQEHLRCENEKQCRHSGLSSLKIPSHEAASEFEAYITVALKCRSCYDIFNTVMQLNDHVMQKHQGLVRLRPTVPSASTSTTTVYPSFERKNGNRASVILQCPSDCVCRVGIRSGASPLQRQQILRRCPNAMRRFEKVEHAAYEVYTCSLCKSTFLMKDEVVDHLMKMHDVPCKFPCYTCLTSFRSLQLKEKHRCSDTLLQDMDKLITIAILPNNVTGKDDESSPAKIHESSSGFSSPIGPIKNGFKRKNGVSNETIGQLLSVSASKKFKYTVNTKNIKKRKRLCPRCFKRFFYVSKVQDHYILEHIVLSNQHTDRPREQGETLMKLLKHEERNPSLLNALIRILCNYVPVEERANFEKLMNMTENDDENWDNKTQKTVNPDTVVCSNCKKKFKALPTSSGKTPSAQDPSILQLCESCESGPKTRLQTVNNGHHEVSNKSNGERFDSNSNNSHQPQQQQPVIPHPFSCRRCGATFPTSLDFKTHKRSVHSLKTMEKLFCCEICDKTYLSPRMLERHKKDIHGESLLDVATKITEEESDVTQKSVEESAKETNESLNDKDEVSGSSINSSNRRDSSDSSNASKEPEEQAFNCSLCEEVIISKVSMKNHLTREHGCWASICQFCNSLLIDTSEVRHMLDCHIVPSMSGLRHVVSGINGSNIVQLDEGSSCLMEEVHELVRTLGKHRLHQLMIYHEFWFMCNNAITRCPVCPELFANRESCRFHYTWNHDDRCLLCDETFKSGSIASDHKKDAHTSMASYYWCIQRLANAIIRGFDLDPAQKSQMLFAELIAKLDESDIEIMGGTDSLNISCPVEQSQSQDVVPSVLEEVVLSEDQLPDSGNMVEVVIGREDSEDDLLSMLNLSPNYESSEQTNYRLLNAGAAPPEEEEDDETTSNASVSVPLPLVAAADPAPAALLPNPVVPASPTVTTTMINSAPPPAENYVTSGVCKYKLDNDEEQLVLVVTDEDLITYRNDIGSLAESISATCESLTLEEITDMLRAYFESVNAGL